MKNLKLPFIALVLILAGSLVLNLALGMYTKRFYLSTNRVALDPYGLKSFQTPTFQTTKNQTLKVAFFGDSRALAWPSPVDLKGVEFINLGIGGQTSAQVLGRFEGHVKKVRPDILVLQVCINDLKTIPLFPARKREIINNCTKNLMGIIRNSNEIGIHVIVSTVFPLGNVPLQRLPVWSSEVADSVLEVNEFIQGLSAKNVTVFDADKVLMDTSGKMKAEYRKGLMHPNETAYKTINKELEKLLLLGRPNNDR